MAIEAGREPSRVPVTAVVPVKPLASAKSRLALPAEHRQALALAFALDTVAALVGTAYVAAVLVVTSDRSVADRVGRLGAHVTDDHGAGLGPAVREGLRLASSRHPEHAVAVVPADLPCLSATDVSEVLAAAGVENRSGAYVPDRAGTGTTFVVRAPGRSLVPCYGPDSAARHRALGLRPLDGAPAGARHDVDTLADLRDALARGVGAHTRSVTAALDLGVPVH